MHVATASEAHARCQLLQGRRKASNPFERPNKLQHILLLLWQLWLCLFFSLVGATSVMEVIVFKKNIPRGCEKSLCELVFL
jgi:hypothetical protein